MSVSELIIEILNCIAESSIIIFYLYNMMKESFRVRKKSNISGNTAYLYDYCSSNIIF